MAQLRGYDETAKERRSGIYVSRCAALSVALFNAVLLVACTSLLLTLRGTSPGVEVHREVRQVGQVPGASTVKQRRYTPLPMSGSTTRSMNATWSNGGREPSDDIRLPRDILPYHYDLRWKPNLYSSLPEEFTVNGTARIYFRCYSPSAVISFNYRRLAFDTFSTAVDPVAGNGNGTAITIVSLCADRISEVYTVTMDRNLSVGEEVILTLKYTAFIQSGPVAENVSIVGIFRSQYSVGNDTRYALFTQMEATEARRAFPCFDDPDVKATFTISIDRQTQLTALSNAPINYTYSENRSSNWVTDVFQTTKPMSTYLVAFAISDYTNVTVYSSGMNPVKIGLWAQNNFVQAGYLNYASTVVPKLLDFYAMYFNYSFNWPKLDLASIPGKDFTIMENWGLTFLESNFILFDKDRSDSVDLLNVTFALSRIISDNWLGNTVSIDWWDDLWLTEGMSVYFQYLAARNVQPTWDTEQFFIYDSFYTYGMWLDQYGVELPVYNANITTLSDVDAQFDEIIYHKGASVIRMLAKLLGEDVFRKAIQNYIQEYQYSDVGHDDLFEEMQKTYAMTIPAGSSAEFNVSDVFFTWILQSGYPLVTVVRGVQTGSSSTQLTLSQNLFLYAPTLFAEYRRQSPYGYLWEIPITYITSYNPNPVRVWMHKDKQIVVALNQSLTASDWVLVNHNLSGFYRVNYDNDNWNALQAQLAADFTKIPLINRAQLIEDSFTLLRSSSNVSQALAFKLASYLTNETEYLPWKMFYDNFQGILKLYANDNQSYARLQNYVSKLAAANYVRLGWNASPNDTITTILLRRLILDLTCTAGDVNCVNESLSRFQRWKSSGFNDSNSVTPDLRHIVYRAAAVYGSYDDQLALVGRYLATASDLTKEAEEVILALACIRNVTALASLLKVIQDLGPQFFAASYGYTSRLLFENIAFTKDGYNAAWNYLNTYGQTAVGRIVILQSFIYVISTPEEAARLKSYLDQYPLRPEEQLIVSWFLQIIQLIVAWRQQNQNAIFDYLASLGF